MGTAIYSYSLNFQKSYRSFQIIMIERSLSHMSIITIERSRSQLSQASAEAQKDLPPSNHWKYLAGAIALVVISVTLSVIWISTKVNRDGTQESVTPEGIVDMLIDRNSVWEDNRSEAIDAIV